MSSLPKLKDRAEFASLLNGRGLTGLAIEVGVCRGEFSEVFIKEWGGDKLYLVDPWETLEDYSDSLNDHDRYVDYIECWNRLQPYFDRVELIRKLSKDAVNLFADNTFDFVYIDANHEYEYVKEDLYLWYPKVKSGGLFAGHDIYSTVTWPGVKQAVHEFIGVIGVEIETTWETGGSWYFFKP